MEGGHGRTKTLAFARLLGSTEQTLERDLIHLVVQTIVGDSKPVQKPVDGKGVFVFEPLGRFLLLGLIVHIRLAKSSASLRSIFP